MPTPPAAARPPIRAAISKIIEYVFVFCFMV
jgi:hypothetical protein